MTCVAFRRSCRSRWALLVTVFFGCGHNQSPDIQRFINEGIKFIVYEVDRNQWTRLATPQWFLDFGTSFGNCHAYQLQTVAPGRYFRAYANGDRIYACDIDRDNLADIGGGNCPGDYPDP